MKIAIHHNPESYSTHWIEYCKQKGIYLDVSTNVDYMEVQANEVKKGTDNPPKNNK